ncbi:MAG: heavy-metal-associated domain-containing protein [Rhodospirillales bacterium]
MKRFPVLAAILLILGGFGWTVGSVVTPAYAQSATVQVAADETTTFKIENMTCALCPVTVKTAMEGVTGVRSVAVDFDAKTATVVFDPSVTTPDAIAAASTDAGYPAAVQG